MFVAFYSFTLSSQAKSYYATIFYHLEIHHVGTQSSFASCVMMTRPNKAKTAVHCCWLLNSFFLFFLFFFLFFGSNSLITSTTLALLLVFVALTYPHYTLIVSSQATSQNNTIFHHLAMPPNCYRSTCLSQSPPLLRRKETSR